MTERDDPRDEIRDLLNEAAQTLRLVRRTFYANAAAMCPHLSLTERVAMNHVYDHLGTISTAADALSVAINSVGYEGIFDDVGIFSEFGPPPAEEKPRKSAKRARKSSR